MVIIYMKIKKADFEKNQIILHKKKKDIYIDIENIKHIIYYRPNFWGFISAYISWSTPGFMEIYLSEKVEGKKAYVLKIKYDDVLKLPQNIKDKIGPRLIP